MGALLRTKPASLRAGGIIIHNNKILLMHVVGAGPDLQEFYLVPGGGQEEGEVLEDTCVREVKEECGIDVDVNDLEFVVVDEKRVAFFFSCMYTGGEVELGGPEKHIHESDSSEQITIEWVTITDTPDLPIAPQTTKEALLRYLREKGI